MPQSIVLDVSYVGNISRHTWVNRTLNPIPVGARFNPANIDPTTGIALPDNFLRVYRGYGDITDQEYTGTANYNSLQVSANRQFRNGLQFGIAYTWSKTLGVISGDGEYVSTYLNARQYNYGKLAYDRPHSLVINYLYDLPKLGKKLDNKALAYITDDWTLSGIASFISGSPVTPSVGWSDGRDVTGSSDGARGLLIGNPFMAPGGLGFNAAAFAPTPKGTFGKVNFGNIPIGILRGPGINNWDMAISKRIPIGSESRYLQLKGETFNTFNHTQFSSYDSSLVYNAAGVQTNNQAGVYNHARDPRKLQFSAKFYF
jgi:hypothetical protein